MERYTRRVMWHIVHKEERKWYRSDQCGTMR